MILSEMQFQGVVVEIVLWFVACVPIADEASLVLISAMNVQLVITVKSLTTKAANRVSSEATLIDRTWIIVAFLHVPLEFLIGKEFVLVSKDFLISRAEIAQFLVMRAPDMSM